MWLCIRGQLVIHFYVYVSVRLLYFGGQNFIVNNLIILIVVL